VDGVLLAVRLLLAAVFTLAGLGKLADRRAWLQTLREFGVPTPVIPSLGLLLPVTELVVALALLPVAMAWWAAWGALVLLFLFVTAIIINLARGRRPACRCFGQFSSDRIGWPTLGRNVVLAAAAAIIIWQRRADVGPSAVDWLGKLTLTERVGLIAGVLGLSLLVVDGWFLIHLLRQNGRLLLRIETLERRLAVGQGVPAPLQDEMSAARADGLQLGAPAPAFHLSDLEGEMRTLDDLCALDHTVMLIFTQPNCGACTTLLPEIARWQRDYASSLTIALITDGRLENNQAKSTEYGVAQVLLQHNAEVAEAYRIRGTPSAVLVSPDGTIASLLAEGPDAIHLLVAQTIAHPGLVRTYFHDTSHSGKHGNGTVGTRTILPANMVGAPAPALKLPDLSGQTVDLADFRGRSTLILFWNPNCQYCQQMLPELKAWEAQRRNNWPQLLLVATGTVEANSAAGLHAPIVLDQAFLVGRAFGVTGTPMAVLVDAQGNIASEIAAGAPAITALANGQALPALMNV
jgi:peroxiredoxin/uncharacterized membrane protein YphA (DoxX/SURF4 family)